MEAKLHLTQFRVEQLTEKWQTALNLGHISITHIFIDQMSEEDDSTIANTTANWEYRQASIRWYLPRVMTIDNEVLEGTVVHELCHVILAPMESHTPEKYLEHREFAVESIARAILNVRQ